MVPDWEGARFVPAVSSRSWHWLIRNGGNSEFPPGSGRRLEFWRKKAIFRHNSLLVSAADFIGRGSLKTDPREHWRIPEDVMLVTDSGGFQVKRGWREDPLDILRWQERNANIAITLDYPSRLGKVGVGGSLKSTHTKDSSSGRVTGTLGRVIQGDDWDTFAGKCKWSYKNNLIYARNRKNRDMKIYLALQGGSEKRYRYWYNYMREFHDVFEGVALAGAIGQAERLPYILSVAYHLGIRKNLHVLGVSGLSGIPLLVWASRYFKHLSFDAASSSVEASKYRLYRVPMYPSVVLGFGSRRKAGEVEWGSRKKLEGLKKLPCVCGICRNVEPDYWYKDTSSTAALSLIVHQLFVYCQYHQTMSALVENPEVFRRYLRNNENERALWSIDYLEYGIKHGPSKASEVFGRGMSGLDSEKMLVPLLKYPQPEKKEEE